MRNLNEFDGSLVRWPSRDHRDAGSSDRRIERIGEITGRRGAV